jgi:hypothetical protein
LIAALLLSAFPVCQPVGVDGDLADVTRAWFIERRLREDRAPEASEGVMLAAQRRALGAWARAARDPRLLREAARLAQASQVVGEVG